MSTRVKRVVRPDMVAHLWAHRTQDSAKSVGRGNFYFDGDTIYSYGSHFPVARHVENKRGESAVLLTTRTYSSTTAGHISVTRGACRHLTVFNVANVTDSGAIQRREQFEEYRARQLDLMKSYAKARSTKPRIFDAIAKNVEEANAFAEFFGLRTRLKMPENADVMAKECERAAKLERDRQSRLRTKRKREDAKRLEKATVALQEWADGDPATEWHRYRYGFDLLPVRLRIKDDKLETSLGAEVPLKDAKRVYKILHRLKSKAQTYKRNGETISLGPFALDSMDGAGTVKVGCHTVEWSEMERVAKLAGL